MQNLKFDIPIWEGFKAAKVEFSSKINGISDCIVIDNETLCLIDFSLNLFFLDYGNKKSKLKCPSFGEVAAELCNFKITFHNLFLHLYGRNLTHDEYKEYTKKCYSPLKKELCIIYLGDYQFFIQPLKSIKCCVFDLFGQVINLRHKFDDPHCLKFYSKYMLMYLDQVGRVFLWNWKLDKRKIIIDKIPLIPVNVLAFPNGNILFLLNCPDAREITYKTFILDPKTLKIEQEKFIEGPVTKPKFAFSQFKEEYVIYYCNEEELNGTVYLQIEIYDYFKDSSKKKFYRLLVDKDYELDGLEIEITFVDEDILMIYYVDQHKLSFFRISTIVANHHSVKLWSCELIETNEDMGYQTSFFQEITFLKDNHFIFYKYEQGFVSLFLASFSLLEHKGGLKPNTKNIIKYRKGYEKRLIKFNDNQLSARLVPDIIMKPLVPSPKAIIKYALSQDKKIYIINDEGKILRYDIALNKFDELFEVSQKVMKSSNQIFVYGNRMIFDLGFVKGHNMLVVCELETRRQGKSFIQVNFDGNVLIVHSKFGLLVQLENDKEETWIAYLDKGNKFHKITEVQEDEDDENNFEDFKYLDNALELDDQHFCGLTVNGNLQIYNLKQKQLVRTRVFDDPILDGGDDIPDDVEADHNGNAEYIKLITSEILALFISRFWFSFVLYNWKTNQIIFVRSCFNSYCKGLLSDVFICRNVNDEKIFMVNWRNCLNIAQQGDNNQAIDLNLLVPHKILDENDFEPNTIEKLEQNLSIVEDFTNMPGALYLVRASNKRLEVLNLLKIKLKNEYNDDIIKNVFETLFS